jgi:hypothetical protein
MKKLYIFILIIVTAWIAKLSYDVFKISAQQNEANQLIHNLEKTNSTLNDQLVAVKRQDPTESTSAPIQKISEPDAGIQPNDMIKQQLSLIEFALKQHEYHYALEKLADLDRNIKSYEISEVLQASLHQAIEKDILAVNKYVQTKEQQQQKINQIIQQINVVINQEIKNPNLKIDKPENKHFWTKWFAIETTEKPTVNLMQRSVILKEVQLRLLISREILTRGQYIQYQQELDDIILLLKQLPDQKSQKILKQVESIKGMSVIPAPMLSTRTLLG